MKKLEKANKLKKELDRLRNLSNHIHKSNLTIHFGSQEGVTFFDDEDSLSQISDAIEKVRVKRVAEVEEQLSSLFK